MTLPTSDMSTTPCHEAWTSLHNDRLLPACHDVTLMRDLADKLATSCPDDQTLADDYERLLGRVQALSGASSTWSSLNAIEVSTRASNDELDDPMASEVAYRSNLLVFRDAMSNSVISVGTAETSPLRIGEVEGYRIALAYAEQTLATLDNSHT